MILTCKQLIRAVTDAREGHLSVVDRVGYKAHLLRCKDCRTYVAQMDAVVDALHGGEPARAAPAELHAALLHAFRNFTR
jgi:hypothetical protein